MTDQFAGYAGSLDVPASICRPIEPSDSVALQDLCRAIYIGSAGTLRLIDAGGNIVTFEGVVAGSILPGGARQVLNTGTTVTGLVAML